ncbi:hypothetical protein FRC07_012248 [Ceratobasidium sp. 392]|nr:hypothetical protein FRC07_012248 [Ceratobasidium sp. 392]
MRAQLSSSIRSYIPACTTLAAVCAHARQSDEKLAVERALAMVNNFGMDIPRGISNLILERSNTTPLYVHAYDWPSEEEADMSDDATYRLRDFADDAVEALKPRIQLVQALQLESFRKPRAKDFTGLLKLWLHHGNPRLSKFLSVHFLSGSEGVHHETWQTANRRIVDTSSHAEEVLLPIQTLYLNGMRFNWRSVAYRGLTDLRLSLPPQSHVATVPIAELTDILIASPMLNILRLAGLKYYSISQLAPLCPNGAQRFKGLATSRDVGR